MPENSLDAFSIAVEAGLAIEMDVRLAVDGQLIVFHDDNLLRMTGVDRRTRSLSVEDRRNLRLLSTDQRIPLLKEVLTLVRGRVPLLMEIKTGHTRGTLENQLMKELNVYRGPYAVESFDPFSMLWFMRNAPQVVRGLLASDFRDETLAWTKKIILGYLLLNRIVRPSFVAYDIRALPFWRIKQLRDNGMPIIGWTVRRPEDWHKANLYCDNAIFEGPFQQKGEDK